MAMDIPALVRRSLGLVAVALAAAGCASLPGTSDGKGEDLIDRNGIDVVAADAGRQLVFFKDPGTNERLCHAPSPDFSRTAGTGVAVAVPTWEGGEVGVGSTASKGAVDLGGREALVLLARELMYRACELATNTNADPATERDIYAKFLAVLVEIARVHPAAGRPPVASAPSTPSSAAPLLMLPSGRRSSGADRNPHDYDPDDDKRR